MIEKLYTVEEVAELASVTGRTIRNYLKSGRLVGRKIGGQWRFPEGEVQRLLTGVEPDLLADSNSSSSLNENRTHEIPYENSPPFTLTSFPNNNSLQDNGNSSQNSAEAFPIQRPPRAPSYYNEPAPLPGAAEPPVQKISEILTEENINSFHSPLAPSSQEFDVSANNLWPAPSAPYAQNATIGQIPPPAATPSSPSPQPHFVHSNTPTHTPVYEAPPAPPTFILNANGMLVEASTGQPIVIANLGQSSFETAAPVENAELAPPMAEVAAPPHEQAPMEIEAVPQPELSDVGNRVTKFISEVHDYSKGPQVCCVVDLHQSLSAARHTSEKLAEIAVEESEEGLLCESFVEFDERYYVARYTLFGTTGFLLRCLNLIG